jgi:hypothetical protein
MASGQYVDITGVQPRFAGTPPIIDQGAYERSPLLTISGRVINVPGTFGEVDIRLMGLSNATEQTIRTVSGAYSFPNIIPGNYRVLPQDQNGLLSFSPDHRDVEVTNANVTVPDFTMTVIQKYVISGRLIGVDVGPDPVTLTGGNLASPVTVNTDPHGGFTFSAQLPGTYVVAPQADYWFCPSNQQTVTLANQDVNISFNAYGKGCYDAATFTYIPIDANGAVQVGKRVDFKLETTCLNPYDFSWDFGDNTTVETSPFPNHTFANPGTYAVSCKITMCPNLTKTIVNDITVICPPPMPPMVSMSTVPGELVTKTTTVTPGAPDEWTIIDQCDDAGHLGHETVPFSAAALPYSCGSQTYAITNWQWKRDGSPEPPTQNVPPNEHTFADLTDGQVVEVTVTDINNNTATDKKKIRLDPCTPDFVHGNPKNPILIEKDDGGNKYELINEDVLLYPRAFRDLHLKIGLGPLPITCQCEVTGISYHWTWILSNPPVRDEGDNNLGSLQPDGNWQTAWQPVNTISLGQYTVTVPVTMTLAGGGTKQMTFTRTLNITYEIPEVACPINGCRSAPQLNSSFYDEIMWERMDPETDLSSGNHEETVPAMGGGFANKQGYGTLDEGVFRYVTVPEDFGFVAHLKNPEDLTNPNVQAGLMVRENNASFGRMIFFGINNGVLTIMSRSKAHQDVAMFSLGLTDETWLQIGRTGSSISCYASVDGEIWDGPFAIGDDADFPGWDGAIEVGLAAAGDNIINGAATSINLEQAQFDNIVMVPLGTLEKPGAIINTVFANGNLISNWSFENEDGFITSGDPADTWFNNHFEAVSGAPAQEGRYFLHTYGKPSGKTLSTPLFSTYFEKNDITATELTVSFWVRSDHQTTITPALLLQPSDGSPAVVSPLPSITISTGQVNTWVKYSIPQNPKTPLPVPDGTAYSGFALRLFDATATYPSTSIDFDNILVAPRFESAISEPVTTLTYANGANQKFQTVQPTADKDIVASLLLDEDGRTSRTLPVFAKASVTPSGLPNPDFHDVKFDPLADMQAYFQYPQENRSWTIDRLATDHGKVLYEEGPLDRVSSVKGRQPSMDVDNSYSTSDGGVADGIAHQSVKTAITSQTRHGGHQLSSDYSDAYGHVVSSVKESSGEAGYQSLTSTRDPDIFDRNWKTIPPQGQGCDQSDGNCIAPTTFRYSTTDQVLETQDPDAGLRQTIYDKLGNARLFQDGNKRNSNQILVNMYDAFSRLLYTYLVNDPDGTKWTNGQVLADDPEWPENQMGYLEWSTMVLRTVYDSVPDVTLLPPGFDAGLMNNLKGRVSARYSYPTTGVTVGTFYSYDNRGNACSIWRWVPGAPIQQQQMDFNMAGQVTERRTLGVIPGAGGQSFTKKEDYYYDKLNRLDKVVDPNTNKVLATFEYLPDGKLSVKHLGEGDQRLRYVYDLADRIGNVQSQTYDANAGKWGKSDIWEQTLSYNDQGNISEQEYQLYQTPDVNKPFRKVSYTYDGFNRLLNADYGSSSTGYGDIVTDNEFDERADYSADGAISFLGRAANAQSGVGGAYVYYPNSHRLRSIAGNIQPSGKDRSDPNNYVYDDNGNMIMDKALKQRINYDYRNMPVKITQYSDNLMTTVQRTIEFIYDADGKRVKKMTTK